MRRHFILAAVSLSLQAGVAHAQQSEPKPNTPAIIHYGKWGAALVFAGFTALGVIEHSNANNSFAELQQFCLASGACAIGPDGRYLDPAAESRYQAVVRGDRAARSWLIGGQVALAGTAAMFIVELLKERGTTNIPLQRLIVTQHTGITRVGLLFPLP